MNNLPKFAAVFFVIRLGENRSFADAKREFSTTHNGKKRRQIGKLFVTVP